MHRSSPGVVPPLAVLAASFPAVAVGVLAGGLAAALAVTVAAASAPAEGVRLELPGVDRGVRVRLDGETN